MADFLEKQITKKRTGANLLGINVDTRAGLTIGNPATEYMLNALEKIAQKAEKAEIDNAKQSFWLDIEERNLKLQNKLSDPNIYGNQESFEEAMKEIENQRKENEKLLAGNMYFTRDEKELAKKQLNNGSFNIYAKAMEKRNTVYTQQQVEKAVYEMDRLVTIGSQLDMNDVESQKMIVDRVIAGTKTLQSLGNWTDERAMEYANRNMMAIEQGRFKNQMDNIINSQLSLEQKKSKMQQLFNVGNNANNIKAMAQSYTDRLGYTGKLADESVKYFEASIKNVYDNVKEQAYKNLERFEYNEEVERAKRERELKNQNDYENKVRGYINQGNVEALTLLNTGKKYGTYEMATDNYNLNKIYGKNITDFGNENNGSVAKLLTVDDRDTLKTNIENAKKQGIINEVDIANNIVYPYLQEKSRGDEYIYNALLKDFGVDGVKEFDADALINGKNDPKYFEVSKIMKNGKGFEIPQNYIEDMTNWYGSDTAAKKRYNDILLKLGGDISAKKALDSFLKGVFVTSEDDIMKTQAKDFKNNNYILVKKNLTEYLDEIENYNYIIENLDRIRKRGVTPILYKPSQIIPENFDIKEVNFVNNQLETNNNFEVIGD